MIPTWYPAFQNQMSCPNRTKLNLVHETWHCLAQNRSIVLPLLTFPGREQHPAKSPFRRFVFPVFRKPCHKAVTVKVTKRVRVDFLTPSRIYNFRLEQKFWESDMSKYEITPLLSTMGSNNISLIRSKPSDSISSASSLPLPGAVKSPSTWGHPRRSL